MRKLSRIIFFLNYNFRFIKRSNWCIRHSTLRIIDVAHWFHFRDLIILLGSYLLKFSRHLIQFWLSSFEAIRIRWLSWIVFRGGVLNSFFGWFIFLIWLFLLEFPFDFLQVCISISECFLLIWCFISHLDTWFHGVNIKEMILLLVASLQVAGKIIVVCVNRT